MIDEVSPSDADFIACPSGLSGHQCEVKLSAVTDPVSSANHVLSVRARRTGTSTGGNVELRCGATLITAFNHAETTSFVTYTYTLSGAEADAITDYSDLRIIFEANTGASPREMLYSWAELAVPDAPAAGGQFMTPNRGYW